MKKNTEIAKEIKSVEKLIKKDLSKEKIISGLYKYIFKSSGKKIRAKLSLISSSTKSHKDRLKLASVIELLHTATLVHDDVVDNSLVRRGAKSVNNIWTNSHGVLIGDYIYSKAFMLMVDIGNKKILKELANATNDISQGELIQLESVQNINISINKLKKISFYKTGRLFEAAATTGAILTSNSQAYIKNIGECAKNLGMVFQIRDDLLDYSTEVEIGKPAFQDIKEGKVTYPFFYAFKNANKMEQRKLKTYLGNKKLNKTEVNYLITKLNGIKKTEQLASRYHIKAIESAKKINNLSVRQEMIELTNIALTRKK